MLGELQHFSNAADVVVLALLKSLAKPSAKPRSVRNGLVRAIAQTYARRLDLKIANFIQVRQSGHNPLSRFADSRAYFVEVQ